MYKGFSSQAEAQQFVNGTGYEARAGSGKQEKREKKDSRRKSSAAVAGTKRACSALADNEAPQAGSDITFCLVRKTRCSNTLLRGRLCILLLALLICTCR